MENQSDAHTQEGGGRRESVAEEPQKENSMVILSPLSSV